MQSVHGMRGQTSKGISQSGRFCFPGPKASAF
jgi:hypothetical protein